MKKGLTMLVAAMVVFGLFSIIGSAAAAHPDAVAVTSAYVSIEGLIIAVMLVGTAGVILVVLSRKQIKSVGKGLDPPIAHLTSAAISVMHSGTGKHYYKKIE